MVCLGWILAPIVLLIVGIAIVGAINNLPDGMPIENNDGQKTLDEYS
jgi:hypothetical protein